MVHKGIFYILPLKIEIQLDNFQNILFQLSIKILTFGNNSLNFSAIRLQVSSMGSESYTCTKLE